MSEKHNGTIQRCPHDRENPYVMVSQTLIRDESLSPNCRWMLIYLLSNKENWEIHPKQIYEHVKKFRGCGRDKVYDWIKEACEAGYMMKEEITVRNLNRFRWLLSETPKFKKSFPHPEMQGPKIQDPDNKYYKKEYITSSKEEDIDKKEYMDKVASSPTPSAEASELTKHFFSQMKKRNPKMKDPNLKKWTEEIDKILRIDKRSVDEVKKVISYLFESNAGFAYVASPQSLREKFDEQWAFMLAEESKSIRNTNRNWAQICKRSDPKKFKSLSFDSEYVYNTEKSTRLTLNINPDEFINEIETMFE